MKPCVLLRRDVPNDLHQIAAYLEQYSVETADRFIQATFKSFSDLAAMPGKGSPKYFRHRRLKGIRSWSVPGFRNFLILYRPTSQGVDIFAVTHGSRRLRRLLNERS